MHSDPLPRDLSDRENQKGDCYTDPANLVVLDRYDPATSSTVANSGNRGQKTKRGRGLRALSGWGT